MPLDSFFPSTYPLIAREALFSVPFCAMIKIDPQGKKLAYAGAGTAGVLNLFVSTDLSLKNAKQATFFKEPRITQMYWNHDGNKLVLLKEKDGTGQLRLYGVDLLSSQVTEYTQSLLQVNAKVFRLHPKKSQAIIGLNHRNPQFHDLYLIDLDTGEFSLFLENDSFVNFLFDSELRLVFKMSINSDTSWTVFNEKGEEFMKISSTDAFHTEFLKTDDKSEFFYLLDNRFSNTTELKQILIKDQKSEKILGHDLKSDIEEVVFVKGNPVAL
ncbi:MAG: hypothetical protein HYZ47_05035 [Simkania negevensis]|nr:hypothetical protein [Simkania negevensis]